MRSPPTRSRLYAVTTYLVIKALAGKHTIVQALYEYFVEDASPARLSHKYGFEKHQIRGYIQRIMEKARDYYRARTIVKHVAPYVLRLKPAFKRINDAIVQCKICGDQMAYIAFEDHLVREHPSFVEEAVFSVIDCLQKDLSRRTLSQPDPRGSEA